MKANVGDWVCFTTGGKTVIDVVLYVTERNSWERERKLVTVHHGLVPEALVHEVRSAKGEEQP